MRQLLISIILASVPLLLSACDTKSSDSSKSPSSLSLDEQKLSCEFTAEGKRYEGSTSIQVFPATKEYSVLCESSGNDSKLVQFVFKDELSARNGDTFKLVSDKVSSSEGVDEVSLTYDLVYVSKDTSTGSVRVAQSGAANELQFTNVSLFEVSGVSVTTSGRVKF